MVLLEIVTGELAGARGQLPPLPAVPGQCPRDVAALIWACITAQPPARPTAKVRRSCTQGDTMRARAQCLCASTAALKQRRQHSTVCAALPSRPCFLPHKRRVPLSRTLRRSSGPPRPLEFQLQFQIPNPQACFDTLRASAGASAAAGAITLAASVREYASHEATRALQAPGGALSSACDGLPTGGGSTAPRSGARSASLMGGQGIGIVVTSQPSPAGHEAHADDVTHICDGGSSSISSTPLTRA